MAKLSLQRKLYVGFIAAFLTLLLLLALAYAYAARYTEARDWTEHTYKVLYQMRGIRGQLLDMLSQNRAYLLTRKAQYLDARDNARSIALQRIAALRGLIVDNPEQDSRLRDLGSRIEALHSRLSKNAEDFPSLSEAEKVERLSLADNLVSQADNLIDTLRNEEERLLILRDNAASDGARQLLVVVLLLLGFASGLLILIFTRLVSDLNRREQAERALRRALVQDATLGAALTLFNEGGARAQLLADLLSLLARQQSFPASAFYVRDHWSGRYRLEAWHGTGPDISEGFRPGEGILGQAVSEERLVELPVSQLRLPVGLAELEPASLLALPIGHRDQVLGILVLASTLNQDQEQQLFLERLGSQLGVALHNLEQAEQQRVLTEQLRQRGEEITVKNLELENANRLKSEFLATMSHELRTPLNAIIGFSEGMRDGLMGPLNDQQREFVGVIFDSGQHLLSLINDVLDLSKIEAGRMSLELGPVDLASLVVNSLSVVKEKAMRGRLQLHSELQPGLSECRADGRKLKQVVYNLLSNAVKFTPEGGSVRLAVRTCRREDLERSGLRLTRPLARDIEEFLELSVTDTGIGIAPEEQDRLFQPFVQLESALTRRHGGTGLGLALVDQLIGLHGGSVGFASQPGEGSRFSALLPLERLDAKDMPESVQTQPPKTGLPADLRQRLALVIEDDPDAQRLVQQQLESIGMQVVLTNGAESGLSLARCNPPDLIILDILLPGMDGWSLLETLRQEPDLCTIPVVITSIVADSNRGISLGAARVLEKPVTQETLMNALGELSIAPRKNACVLVVDDDPQAVALLSQQLERQFERVLKAFGGREGIAAARHAHPDLIVLDLMMPEMSGFEVVEELKGDPATTDIPILILTAKTISDAERKQLSGHVEHIMQKSEFNHGRFLNEVKRALNIPA